jgi:hypothetical protein
MNWQKEKMLLRNRAKWTLAAGLIFAAGLALAACNVESESTVEEGGDLNEPDVMAGVTEEGQATTNLIAELRDQGATVHEAGALQNINLGLKGVEIMVNGAAVQVFEFASADEASAEAQTIVSGESTAALDELLGGAMHVYQEGELVVLYSGGKDDVMTRLSDALGAEVQAE